ncbi:hypothetical protein [Rhodopirellula halodulae]|uniref:hypothetical protein n=1 Tax=Rhodopirellula halodulae TaxID=2894198 RepID=UPI001E2DFDCA|nr:hypothetical protein [Rhodopirellula sp. JC737]MCC9658863.1 hypothetical protein [Rhodopirellula sp. JC737]
MIARWLVGMIFGTLIVAITSPLFVRSYVPRQWDDARQQIILRPGDSYRWRSEGYATTAIGPHGMMGRTSLPTRPSATERELETSPATVALWGDSQAEGVSVADTNKLFRQIERFADQRASGTVHVLPLGKSGDDANAWIAQMPLVEDNLGVTNHVILLCETVDLLVQPPTDTTEYSAPVITNDPVGKLPDFLLQAAKNLVIDDRNGGPRSLRFQVGPVNSDTDLTHQMNEAVDSLEQRSNFVETLTRIREASDRDVTLVYAPRSPVVFAGGLRWHDPDATSFTMIRETCEDLGIDVIDCRQAFREMVQRGVFPHGFHNGEIGNGHLNEDGYRVIAEQLIQSWKGDTRGATE